MTTPRTTDEIVERLQSQAARDFFGFQADALFEFVSFDDAKRSGRLKYDATDDGTWTSKSITREALIECIRDYMTFAWEKALGHRGISAGRSIQKFAEWLWVLGDDEAYAFVDDDANYAQYGVPALAYICERFGFPIPDGARVSRMRRGDACTDGCEEGCGE